MFFCDLRKAPLRQLSYCERRSKMISIPSVSGERTHVSFRMRASQPKPSAVTVSSLSTIRSIGKAIDCRLTQGGEPRQNSGRPSSLLTVLTMTTARRLSPRPNGGHQIVVQFIAWSRFGAIPMIWTPEASDVDPCEEKSVGWLASEAE
jgi:hypothetical protein